MEAEVMTLVAHYTSYLACMPTPRREVISKREDYSQFDDAFFSPFDTTFSEYVLAIAARGRLLTSNEGF